MIAFEKDGLTNKMTEISGFIGPSGALTRKCSVKKVFLEISQNHSVHWGINPPNPPAYFENVQEITCVGVSFLIKLHALRL